MNTKKLAFTAFLLALSFVCQTFKGISPYITGPLVNAILVFATLSLGLYSGLIIAAVTPLFAFIIGATPILHMAPIMLPVIMIGNALLVICTHLFAAGKVSLGIGAGALLKACFLWLTVSYGIMPGLAGKLSPSMVHTVKLTFSLTQLITALIGGYAAYLIWQRIGGYIKKRL